MQVNQTAQICINSDTVCSPDFSGQVSIQKCSLSTPSKKEPAYKQAGSYIRGLTLILLMWRIGRAPNNASRWQMEFNSGFKGLIKLFLIMNMSYLQITITDLNYKLCLHIPKVLKNIILKNFNIII